MAVFIYNRIINFLQTQILYFDCIYFLNQIESLINKFLWAIEITQMTYTKVIKNKICEKITIYDEYSP